MSVTQKEIADKLNLARSTVGKVLAGRTDVWISEENRRRIHLAAKELNYQPNAAATALRSGKTNIVAILYECSPGDSGAYAGMTEAIADHLSDLGNALLVNVARTPAKMTERIREISATRACDLAILLGTEDQVEPQAILLESLGIPFVVKGHFEESHPHWPQIDFDHVRMMRSSVEFLVGRGHRRLSFFGHNNDMVYASKLLDGYRLAVAELAPDTDPIRSTVKVNETSGQAEMLDDVVRGWRSRPAGLQTTSAVIAVPGGTWRDLDMALHRHGVRMAPGQFEAAGLAYYQRQMLYGQGHMFPGVGLYNLGQELARQLVEPLILGKPLETKIVRVLPDLQLGPPPILPEP